VSGTFQVSVKVASPCYISMSVIKYKQLVVICYDDENCITTKWTNGTLPWLSWAQQL